LHLDVARIRKKPSGRDKDIAVAFTEIQTMRLRALGEVASHLRCVWSPCIGFILEGPQASTAVFKDSSALNFTGGNPWVETGWDLGNLVAVAKY
jgi:hypothetical protein